MVYGKKFLSTNDSSSSSSTYRQLYIKNVSVINFINSDKTPITISGFQAFDNTYTVITPTYIYDYETTNVSNNSSILINADITQTSTAKQGFTFIFNPPINLTRIIVTNSVDNGSTSSTSNSIIGSRLYIFSNNSNTNTNFLNGNTSIINSIQSSYTWNYPFFTSKYQWSGVGVPSSTYNLAIGSGPSPIRFSYGSVIWNSISNSSIIFSEIKDICYSSYLNIYCAVGSIANSGSVPMYTIAWSNDSIYWNNCGNGGIDKSILTISVSGNGRTFVAGGSGNYNISYSADGKNWYGCSGKLVSTVTKITWGTKGFLAVAIPGVNMYNTQNQSCLSIKENTSTTILYSYNGIIWEPSFQDPTSIPGFNIITGQTAADIVGIQMKSVCCGYIQDAIYVAVGTSKFRISQISASANVNALPFSGQFNNFATDPANYSMSSIIYSYDCIHWYYPQLYTSPVFFLNNNCIDICWGPAGFVAISNPLNAFIATRNDSGTGDISYFYNLLIYYSTNGVQWYTVYPNNSITKQQYPIVNTTNYNNTQIYKSISWVNGYYVISATTENLISSDGQNWTVNTNSDLFNCNKIYQTANILNYTVNTTILPSILSVYYVILNEFDSRVVYEINFYNEYGSIIPYKIKNNNKYIFNGVNISKIVILNPSNSDSFIGSYFTLYTIKTNNVKNNTNCIANIPEKPYKLVLTTSVIIETNTSYTLMYPFNSPLTISPILLLFGLNTTYDGFSSLLFSDSYGFNIEQGSIDNSYFDSSVTVNLSGNYSKNYSNPYYIANKNSYITGNINCITSLYINNKIIYLAGTNTDLLYSYDGKLWNSINIGPLVKASYPILSIAISSIAHNDSIIFALGYYTINTEVQNPVTYVVGNVTYYNYFLLASVDGINWGLPNNPRMQVIQTLTYWAQGTICSGSNGFLVTNGLYIMAINNDSSLKNTLGIGEFFDWTINNCCYGNGKYIFSSVGGISYEYDFNNNDYGKIGTLFSIDSSSSKPLTPVCTSMCYGKNKFVAVGRGDHQISYSYDGLTWIKCKPVFKSIVQLNSVCYDGIKFTAVGTGSLILSSVNGIKWKPKPYYYLNIGCVYSNVIGKLNNIITTIPDVNYFSIGNGGQLIATTNAGGEGGGGAGGINIQKYFKQISPKTSATSGVQVEIPGSLNSGGVAGQGFGAGGGGGASGYNTTGNPQGGNGASGFVCIKDNDLLYIDTKNPHIFTAKQTSYTVILMAGGGSGGGGANAVKIGTNLSGHYYAGSGGCSGQVIKTTINCNIGDKLSITVGFGGIPAKVNTENLNLPNIYTVPVPTQRYACNNDPKNGLVGTNGGNTSITNLTANKIIANANGGYTGGDIFSVTLTSACGSSQGGTGGSGYGGPVRTNPTASTNVSTDIINSLNIYVGDDKSGSVIEPFTPNTNECIPSNIYPELFPQSSNYNIPAINTTATGLSIAFSGGGARSCIASIGYMRALNNLNNLNKKIQIQYVSTVGGGSWFWGVYSFAQTNGKMCKISDLLGSSIQSFANYTKVNLETQNADMSDYIAQRFVNTNIINDILYATIPRKDLYWNSAIGKMLLDYYMLNDDNLAVCINQAQSDDITQNNSRIQKTLIYNSVDVSVDVLPFWICNTTLFFNYLTNTYPYIVVPMTPLYSGIAQKITDVNKLSNNYIGGYFIDNFTFGVTQPINCSQNGDLCDSSSSLSQDEYIYTSYVKNTQIRLLRDMLGTSSSSLVNALYKPINFLPQLNKNFIGNKISLDVFNFIYNQYSETATNNSLSNAINLLREFVSTISYTQLIPIYNIWGTLPLQPVKSSSLCVINNDKNISSDYYPCQVPNGYDPNSCKITFDNEMQCVANDNSTSSSTSSSISPYLENEYVNQTAKLGDGSYSDNTGILSLIARGAQNIIAFINTDNQYFVNSKGIVIPNSEQIFKNNDTDIAPLFGAMKINSKNISNNYTNNSSQIFATADYNKVVEMFSQNMDDSSKSNSSSSSAEIIRKSGPTYALITLTVLSNPLYNINITNTTYKVNILFILLQPSINFYNNLPLDTQNNIDNFQISKSLMFNNFPNYSDILQNYNVDQNGFYGLSLAQSNLLSSYTDWSLNYIYEYDSSVKNFINSL